MGDFIEKQKKEYKRLKPCFCPAIQEMVHFNADGLQHLLYKNRRPRSRKEKEYRMHLVKHLTKVIASATKAKQIDYKNPTSSVWILEWATVEEKIKGQTLNFKVKVILRRKGRGRVHFFSVMRRKNKTKKPRK